MSLTGLALVVFLVLHLAGNLLFFKDADHATFDAYAETMRTNPLLPVAEIGLVALFLLHLLLALSTAKSNREARPKRYAVDASRGERTLASSSMLISGGIILVFVIVHLLDFRLNDAATGRMGAAVTERLTTPLGAAIYLIGVLAVGVHLSHAVRSALQSLGANHPRYNPLIQRGGPLLAGILFVGFAAFPVVLFASQRRAQMAAAEQSAAPSDAVGNASEEER